uniref:ATP synthase complex subunit 8 n=1 Tax=Mesembrinella sp. ACMJ-2016 TaxID=1783248 RepID=A0A140F1R8_9MUSC|nr:ATP synthase F0 subunit 8 [Mesembrinella sp. ACMJ-2016]
MPQMSPIYWLILFIIFTTAFIIFSTINYFSFNPCMPKSTLITKTLTNSLNWKW